jgi:16S rRNA (guanine1207-N2)-methyltransferase
MVEKTFTTPVGNLELLRHPVRERSQLRAWDAADAYVLRHLSEQTVDGPVVLLNDAFGALSCGLAAHGPVSVPETAMARTATVKNRKRNRLAEPSFADGAHDLPAQVATLVVKVPKSLGQLEDQLHRLRPQLADGALVVGAGMVRSIHTSTLDLFESIIGPTVTSLAERKARLIHASYDSTLDVGENPWPAVWSHDGLTLSSDGGVFSASSLDIGTRFLLDNLPDIPDGRVVDLGCGNGVLGVVAGRANEVTEVVFIDAAERAARSAARSWTANHGDRPAAFHVADRMQQVVDPASVDLVLNNPPFHDERAIGDATAWDMFVDAHAVLRPGGELRVIANQQLGHHSRLHKIFGNCEAVASNRKFVVLSSIR